MQTLTAFLWVNQTQLSFGTPKCTPKTYGASLKGQRKPEGRFQNINLKNTGMENSMIGTITVFFKHTHKAFSDISTKYTMGVMIKFGLLD